MSHGVVTMAPLPAGDGDVIPGTGQGALVFGHSWCSGDSDDGGRALLTCYVYAETGRDLYDSG